MALVVINQTQFPNPPPAQMKCKCQEKQETGLFEELLLGLNLGLILALILVLTLRLLVDRFEGGCMGFPLNPGSLWKIELALDSFPTNQNVSARPREPSRNWDIRT